MTSPKIVVRTKYQYSFNNPDNKFNSKNRDKVNNYTNNMLDYYSNMEKKATSLIDYYTGKINKDSEINLIMENGKYATNEELEKRKKYISKQINNSNLWQTVISFDNNYIDSNISLEDLEQVMVKDVLPQFFRNMGFEDIKKMQYQLSLHTNTDNYHFHIAFMEKSPNTKDSSNKLKYRRKGKIPKKSINFLKAQTMLAIERKHEFKPKAININKDIDDIKKYFQLDSYNYILKDKSNFILEEKILNLGKLLTEKVESKNNKIKFNSIYDSEIRKLTKEIKKELFSNKKELNVSIKVFNKQVGVMNSYFEIICKKNNVSLKDVDYSYTINKEKYLDNYILNSIANYSRNHYKKEYNRLRIKDDDIIQSIITNIYKKNIKYTKRNIIDNYYKNNNFQLQRDIRSAIKNINNELEDASNEFHKLFVNDKEYIK